MALSYGRVLLYLAIGLRLLSVGLIGKYGRTQTMLHMNLSALYFLFEFARQRTIRWKERK
jgi:hypothetical protein